MSDMDNVYRKAVGMLLLLTLLLTMTIVSCDDPEGVVTAPTQMPTSTPTAAATPILEDTSASPGATVPTPRADANYSSAYVYTSADIGACSHTSADSSACGYA